MGNKNKIESNNRNSDEEIITINERGEIIAVDKQGNTRLGVRPPEHTFY